jgi:hypothetical protein
MKHDPWKRLAEVARSAPRLGAASAPFGFETRVLAAVRAAERRGQDEFLPWLGVLRGSAFFALAAMIAALLIAHGRTEARGDSELDVADAVLQVTMLYE